jgi:hypothetical protein
MWHFETRGRGKEGEGEEKSEWHILNSLGVGIM